MNTLLLDKVFSVYWT